jgi:hypothetical protein
MILVSPIILAQYLLLNAPIILDSDYSSMGYVSKINWVENFQNPSTTNTITNSNIFDTNETISNIRNFYD